MCCLRGWCTVLAYLQDQLGAQQVTGAGDNYTLVASGELRLVDFGDALLLEVDIGIGRPCREP